MSRENLQALAQLTLTEVTLFLQTNAKLTISWRILSERYYLIIKPSWMMLPSSSKNIIIILILNTLNYGHMNRYLFLLLTGWQSNNIYLEESLQEIFGLLSVGKTSWPLNSVNCANACRFSRLTNLPRSVYCIVLEHPVTVWWVFTLKRTGHPIPITSPKHNSGEQIRKKLHRFSDYSFFFIVTVP